MIDPPLAERERKKRGGGRKEEERGKRERKWEKGEASVSRRAERNCPERSQPRIYRSPGTNRIVQPGR